MPKSPWKLTPDMKLTRRFPSELAGEGLDRFEQVRREVAEMKRAGEGEATAPALGTRAACPGAPVTCDPARVS